MPKVRQVLRPLRQQQIAAGGDEQPGEGDRAVTHPGGNEAPDHRPDRQYDQNDVSIAAALVWSRLIIPRAYSSTSTSVTINAAPAANEAPSAARNGRKCTPAGSIRRVRANRSKAGTRSR